MLKKILYAIVIIVIIVILSIMWSDSKKEDVLPTNPPVTVSDTTTLNTETSISDELDTINVDSGIDADLIEVDTSIQTL